MTFFIPIWVLVIVGIVFVLLIAAIGLIWLFSGAMSDRS